jgi:uncharacterized membrane protein (UPF0127 family)
MRLVQIENRDHPLPTPLKVRFCDTFFSRLRGLTFQTSLPLQKGLLLVQSRDSRLDSAIHMLGVNFDLGVVWLSDNLEAVDLKIARRWRPLYIPKEPARFVLEIHPQRLPEFHLGDKLYFSDESTS